ncbi:hypothetical protein PC129_g15496 [Phytophthora cactorum]|uniref:Uncharacterized protein n=1 Tax=Phytophthora cactorum TaxID=29920 RepID=A0A329RP31_9STRA|nr:hypothetical protein PC111_g15762 [Phytophthora cactorum]KAG2815142.1 hypothetical protein PC112_g14013 [Phytophthora cactorum]KAG2850168.1 hypothetical protein PC113_g17018 [Phytophthora cactorum]KAG2909515.1 hypothetical protein PC115_g13223 [Phytophthora cactorum]KAG2926786.1 hypothetical protein PC117_g14765 [Phytophthora cactorum]
MALNNTFTTKQACSYYFTALLDVQDELTEHFRCQYGTTRKQHPKTGYSNMFNHVMKRHPDYLSAMKMSDFNSGNLENRLKVLLGEPGDFHSATMKLKDDGMAHLASDAVIVKDPDFERAYVLALSGRIEELTGDQQLMLDPFEMTPQAVIPDSTTGRPQSFADKVLAATKKQRTAKKGALHTPAVKLSGTPF